MPSKTTTALAALLFFGSASAALANTNNQNDHHGSFIGRAELVTMSSGRAGAVNHAAASIHGRGEGLVRHTAARPRREGPVLSSWHHGQNDGLDQIDCARWEPDSHQRRTCDLCQI